MKQILITGYVNPDLDAVAGTTAYSEFLNKRGKNSVVGLIGEPHDEAKYILDNYNISYPKIISNADDFDEVVLVDASDLIGIEGKIAPEKVIEIIDHRKVHEADKFPNAKVQIELVGSASTLVAEKFIQNNIEISKESAILLCGAIISNTLNFKGGVTTDRDRLAFEYLNKIAQLSPDFAKELFKSKSDLSGDKMKERILGDLAWFNMNNKKVGIAQIEIVGVRKLIENRLDEIVDILDKLKREFDFDILFQNSIELEEGMNFFIAKDTETQKILEKILGIKFNGFVAERNNLIMRKQIVPLLKEELEK
ncbi:MAG TPA: DHH family phosphoesterase [Candidatus Paceibacterota bacterium]|nr:DHH family phosphoesterase [Candidatus Paceibacterota bacterium]